MDTQNIEKINQAVTKAKKLAVVLPEQLNVDLTCAAIALKVKLLSMGKTAEIFTSATQIPETKFLHHEEKFYPSFGNPNELLVKIKAETSKPSQLRYEKDSDDLLIYVSSDEGEIKASDVEVIPSQGNFDLMIILGASTISALGGLYEKNTEKFFSTPKVSISNDINQEYFSNITWVELEATSVCEQLANWFSLDNSAIIPDQITTSLLAGIISQTSSFRDPKTTPENLAMAARLIKQGARQQDIIQHLFKTKPFNLLQLWGRALARVKDHGSLFYTIITKQDLEKTQTGAPEVIKVLEEIINMVGGQRLTIILVEQEGSVLAYLAAPTHYKLVKLAKQLDLNYSGSSSPLYQNIEYLSVILNVTSTVEAERLILTLNPTGI